MKLLATAALLLACAVALPATTTLARNDHRPGGGGPVHVNPGHGWDGSHRGRWWNGHWYDACYSDVWQSGPNLYCYDYVGNVLYLGPAF